MRRSSPKIAASPSFSSPGNRARIGRLSAACALTLTIAVTVGGAPALSTYNSWAGSAPKVTSSLDSTTSQIATVCRPWLRCPTTPA